MKTISFVKYTSYGNNFVIVDDTGTPTFTESEMSRFAYEATDTCFGVGCDNFLVIQRANHETLQSIHRTRGYWKELPDPQGAEFIFRMFEPNGDEAFSCGNGLLCVAAFLFDRYGIRSTRIMTEIPFPKPKTITIGSTDSSTSWANLDRPRTIPSSLVEPMMREPLNHGIEILKNLTVHFRSHDLAPYTDADSLDLSGYLIFTGEPHLVIFPDDGFSETQLSGTIFDYSPLRGDLRKSHRRANFGSWLVNRVGAYVNTHCRDHFPAGLNVNFARVIDKSGIIEYRCYERGINKETLACGTGALAVAYVAQCLNRCSSPSITILPHQCRRYQPEAEIELHERDNGWLLNGQPVMLVEGTFMLTSSRQSATARRIPEVQATTKIAASS